LDALHDGGLRRIKMALHNTRLYHMAASCGMGGNVATGLLKISLGFLSKKTEKNR